MRLLVTFLGYLLIGLTVAAPTVDEDETIVITKSLFLDELAIYTGKHDIVSIVVPLNDINFDDDNDDDNDDDDDGIIVFFVEADVNDKGNRVDQGLYVLKHGVPKKLLDHGRDAAASSDDSKLVFFAAKDGLYVYNAEKNTAENYGSVTDSLIGIAKENGTDAIYILTEDKHLYKITSDGKKKTKIEDVKNAQQIVLDHSNNLYFYDETKQPFVLTKDGIKKIAGLPKNPSSVRLLKPLLMFNDSVPFISDDIVYTIYANGTSEKTDFVLQDKPSAYGMEATLIQYFGFEKKIYSFNVFTILLGTVLEDLKKFLSKNKDSTNAIAARYRNNVKP